MKQEGRNAANVGCILHVPQFVLFCIWGFYDLTITFPMFSYFRSLKY
jgi:hypothetical protein